MLLKQITWRELLFGTVVHTTGSNEYTFFNVSFEKVDHHWIEAEIGSSLNVALSQVCWHIQNLPEAVFFPNQSHLRSFFVCSSILLKNSESDWEVTQYMSHQGVTFEEKFKTRFFVIVVVIPTRFLQWSADSTGFGTTGGQRVEYRVLQMWESSRNFSSEE